MNILFPKSTMFFSIFACCQLKMEQENIIMMFPGLFSSEIKRGSLADKSLTWIFFLMVAH